MSPPRPPAPDEWVSRRRFLTTAAAAVGSLALGCSDRAVPTAPRLARSPRLRLPDPRDSGIEHVVLVMMENRSFDHFLGWMPRADGRQAGLSYTDTAGVRHETYPLAPDFQGCGHQDPDHTYAGGRVQYDDSACDGWLRVNDVFSIGYYRRKDLPFLGQAAPDWTSFDRYFAAFLGPTFCNRLYQHAGQTDRLSNTLTVSTLPTIWDRLASAGIRGRYYFVDLPVVALWGSKYRPISRPFAAFEADCAAGTLPAVSFVDPGFLTEATGTGADDHPFNDIRAGEAFLNGIYNAVTRSPAWPNTVLLINCDEWGGFFDHVPPPLAPIPDADRAAGSDGRRGFRTPMVLISPFARREHTSHTLYDHTSVLRLVEWRWDLEPLTVRDRTAHNLADELDFNHVDLDAPVYAVPSVTGAACPARASIAIASPSNLPTAPASPTPPAPPAPPAPAAHWAGLHDVARRHGWSV